MHLINRIFNDKTIRTVWNKEGNEIVTNCEQLKPKVHDGKYRMTDVVDIEVMFRIIESMVWNDNGIVTEVEYAMLTNEIYKE